MTEPERLRRGRQVHGEIQEGWAATAEGVVKPEKAVAKRTGRRGRIDVHVDAGDGLVAVVEIKASDWNAMTDASVRRNVRRQIRQIWGYIEAELAAGRAVSPGVVFPERPDSAERVALIEGMFGDEGIAVVWEDESVEERRLRAGD